MSNCYLPHELLITGFGGQGVVLAGKLLASAALAEGRQVVWAPSYGPEMRGGPVHCTIIISNRLIGSPEVSVADSLLIMDQASLLRFAGRLKTDGLLIINSSLLSTPDSVGAAFNCRPDSYNPSTISILPIPASEEAEQIGDQRVANVIMLGAFLHERPVVAISSLVQAMRDEAVRSLQGKNWQQLLKINEQALVIGCELAREVKNK